MFETQLHWVTGIEPYRVALSARPKGGAELGEEVVAWKAAGVTMVVSLLEASEVRELELKAEPQTCSKYGVSFRSLPIPDRGIPESSRSVATLLEELSAAVRAGDAVAIHCRAGIGRTGLVDAALLHHLGVRPDELFTRLSLARGVAVPDTEAQVQWVKKYVSVATVVT